MIRGDETLAMGDCAINIDYQDTVDKEGNVTFTAAQKLAEVAIATAETAKVFGIDPKGRDAVLLHQGQRQGSQR